MVIEHNYRSHPPGQLLQWLARIGKIDDENFGAVLHLRHRLAVVHRNVRGIIAVAQPRGETRSKPIWTTSVVQHKRLHAHVNLLSIMRTVVSETPNSLANPFLVAPFSKRILISDLNTLRGTTQTSSRPRKPPFDHADCCVRNSKFPG